MVSQLDQTQNMADKSRQIATSYKVFLYYQVDFNSLSNFSEKLQQIFCFLSWLRSSYNISIKKAFYLNPKEGNQTCKLFTIGNKEAYYMLYQKRQSPSIAREERRFYTISYNLRQITPEKAQQEIQVDQYRSYQNSQLSFQTVFYQTQGSRDIQIDVNLFAGSQQFQKYFDFPQERYIDSNINKPTFFRKLHNFGFLNEKDLEYYHIEEETMRYNRPKGPHMNLAFQGGGAKGVSYVGVNLALNNMRRRIKDQSNNTISLPIRSVIGSSAGGILSLAISAGIDEPSMKYLCMMMDTLTDDMLIETVQQGNDLYQNLETFNKNNSDAIGPNFFEDQGENIKRLLHHLGLVEDSLSNVIFEILQTPTIQNAIINWINASSPSISALLTFKDQPNEQGESITCCCGSCFKCCCRQKKDHLQKINFYGLLYAALMTGNAVENILAYCLVLFFRDYCSNKPSDIPFNVRQKKMIRLLRNKSFRYGNSVLTIDDINKEAERVINSQKQYRKRKTSSSQRILNADIEYIRLPLMNFAKTLTLLEYYEMIGVQFTCTSVDLNDKIERFFNHKTTPNLPACKAVQMTGSFPVAFESLTWQKEWGFYYVHYHDLRRQIDLTGHHFTDGGLLANFPLKFLDNQKFRPMYFSHKKTKDTILYGFGLDQLPDFPEIDNSVKKSQALSALKSQLFSVAWPKLLGFLLKCRCGSSQVKVGSVKVVQFLLSLVAALRQSDRNLNMQCFKHQIIHTVLPYKSIYDVINYIRNSGHYYQIMNIFEKLDASIDSHYKKPMNQLIDDQFAALNILADKNPLTYKQINEIQWVIQNNLSGILKNGYKLYKYFEGSDRKIKVVHNFLKELKKQIKFNPPSAKDIDQARINAKSWVAEMRKLYDYEYTTLKNMTASQSIHQFQQKLFINEEQVQRFLIQKFSFTPFFAITQVQEAIGKIKKSDYESLSLNYFVEMNVYRNYSQIKDNISGMLNFNVQKYIRNWQRKGKQIGKGKGKFNIKVHILLEAVFTSHYYYPNYVEIVENILTEINFQYLQKYPDQWAHLSIDILSCTDFHAIFGVLYAIGEPFSRIKHELTKIASKFTLNPNIDQEFESEEWMKSSALIIRQLLNKAWSQKYNIFEHYEQLYDRNPTDRQFLKPSVDPGVINRSQISAEYLSEQFELVLDYTVSSFKQLSKLSRDKRSERIGQLLSLGDYKSKNIKQSNRGKRILKNIFTYTGQLLMIISEQVIDQNNYQYITGSLSKETIFRGMVLKKFINAFEYKLYIFETLQRVKIEPHITLKNFYDTSKFKILLNFDCIKTFEQRFSLINKHTRPNMPLWAALMAAASMPYLEGQFSSRREWEIKQTSDDIETRKAYLYFKNEQANGNPGNARYISGNFISTLPLELLTNGRLIRSKLSPSNDHSTQEQIIEVTFSFNRQSQKKQKRPIMSQKEQDPNDSHASVLIHNNETVSNRIYEESNAILNQMINSMGNNQKFLGLCDVIGLLCEFWCCFCCSTKGMGDYLKDIISRVQVLSMLSIRTNSNDNLVLHLYYDQLIKLPLRVGTLDFYKINEVTPDLEDTIRQAAEVTKELCRRYGVKDNKLDDNLIYDQTVFEFSFVRYKDPAEQQDSNAPESLYFRLKFASYTIWRDIVAKYRITYKLSASQEEYRAVDIDHIDVKFNNPNSNLQIYLKYDYCDTKIKILEAKHKVTLNMNTLINHNGFTLEDMISRQSRAIFSYNFKQFHKPGKIIEGYWTRVPGENLNPPEFAIQSQGFFPDRYKCEKCFNDLLMVLPDLSKNMCNICDIEDNLIAYQCKHCNRNLCICCKISNFIVKDRSPENTETIVRMICPKTKKEFLPIDYKQDKQMLICFMCNRFAKRIWRIEHPESHQQQRFNICGNCLLFISELSE